MVSTSWANSRAQSAAWRHCRLAGAILFNEPCMLPKSTAFIENWFSDILSGTVGPHASQTSESKGKRSYMLSESKPQQEQLSGPTHCTLDRKAATYAILLRMRVCLAFQRAHGQTEVELSKHSETGAHYISCTSCSAQQASNVQKPRVCL